MKDIFEKDLSGEMVPPDEPGYDALIDDIFSTMETAQELSTVSIRDQKRVHELMGRILGKNVRETSPTRPPQRDIRAPHSHRGQSMDRHQLHHIARSDNRLRRHSRSRKCGDKKC